MKEKEVISYDFDGVLHKDMYYTSNGQGHPKSHTKKRLKPIRIMLDKFNKDKNKYDVHIITHRSQKSRKLIYDFLKNNKIYLPYRKIHTIGYKKNKSITIKKIKSKIHYEDSVNVLKDIRMKNKSVELVFINTNHHLNNKSKLKLKKWD
jgi:hypothetical protein